jgi:hypothetical protein
LLNKKERILLAIRCYSSEHKVFNSFALGSGFSSRDDYRFTYSNLGHQE